MSPTLLTIDHASNWSWGETIDEYIPHWHGWQVARFLRWTKIDIQLVCNVCHEVTDHTVVPPMIGAGLTKHFDLVLVQNVDTLPLMEDLSNAVCRSAGMVVNEQYAADRYNEWLQSCRGIIATNDALYSVARSVNENAVLIANGVDLEVFKPAPQPAGRAFTVGFAGNIVKQGLTHKGYRYWVGATTRMFGRIEISKRLNHLNKVRHAEMPREFYHGIDCLVLPSLSEGCSNVITEALACGVPVLTTQVGFHGERLVDGENVLWIERHIDDIIAKIDRLIGDPTLQERLAVGGRRFAEKHHDIKAMAAQYVRFFGHLKGKNHG